jgi:hypothetical protein
MINPQYSLGMTYEEYCVWQEGLSDYYKSLFGPPHDKELWNSVDNLKEHIEKLKEKLKNPGSSVGAMIARCGIEQAKARLEYLKESEPKGI